MSDVGGNNTTTPSGPPPQPGPETGYYGPQEPPQLIWLENASFAGNTMGGICYGMTFVLFFQCVFAIINSPNKDARKPMLLYVIFMFALGTIFTAGNLNLQQHSYIDFRNFPGGGPLGYALSQYSTWRGMTPNVVYTISNWFADGLLMYRCYVIYNMQKWVLVIPGIMFGGSISMGVITLYKSSRPGSNLWAGITVNFGLPYFVLSVALNVMLTLIISFRLLWHSRKYNLSTSSSGVYKRIVSMLVESCALYSLFSILFIGTYAAGNYASDLFLPILSQVQIIAPFLIIIRVATRRSVTDYIHGSSGSGSGYRGGNIVTGEIQFQTTQLSSFHTRSHASGHTTAPSFNTQTAMEDLSNDSFGDKKLHSVGTV
ncbi:hypothetical protein E1B28_005076 [Marasmius oreades]|uniref:Uncharacterized protein n=1 Tax=Marasmius oreades TaxID=181124 RepID=A0A9P8ADX7_9AGAR|nr:uncharacterized protein E1B28_005076 [Marasmius oreades]KAG7097755.1 hypothetical protein E1B28_005076 [Marasmius oreades]